MYIIWTQILELKYRIDHQKETEYNHQYPFLEVLLPQKIKYRASYSTSPLTVDEFQFAHLNYKVIRKTPSSVQLSEVKIIRLKKIQDIHINMPINSTNFFIHNLSKSLTKTRQHLLKMSTKFVLNPLQSKH